MRLLYLLRFELIIWIFAVTGCNVGPEAFTAKWAINDENYAQQYSAPYSKNPLKKLSQMGQQMVDARFQKEKIGTTIGIGVPLHNQASAEVGFFCLPSSWSTLRLTATAIGDSGIESDTYPHGIGARFGGRVYAPTRLSPYVGLSGWCGASSTNSTAQVPNVGSSTNDPTVVSAAVIPEAGVSLWVTSTSRLNFGYGRLLSITSGNHDSDFIGVSFDWTPCFFKSPDEDMNSRPDAVYPISDEELRRIDSFNQQIRPTEGADQSESDLEQDEDSNPLEPDLIHYESDPDGSANSAS